MGFSTDEREQLLSLKGVGDTVIKRIEQLGYGSFKELAQADPLVVTKEISLMMGSSCWHNSPQARAAIRSAVELARQRV